MPPPLQPHARNAGASLIYSTKQTRKNGIAATTAKRKEHRTMPQLPRLNCQYGAPMGRLESRETPVCKVRLFRVRLDAGGYDDGGAYWGTGQPPLLRR